MNWRHFTVTLRTEEPFRIGALQDPLSGIDNPVAQIGGRIIVQGSSLKGAYRAELERFLIERYSKATGMKPCIPSDDKTLSDGERALINQGKYKAGGNCTYKEEEARARRDEPTRPKDDYICPACYLLGAQGIVGFVRVPYLFTGEKAEKLYSVRLDRATQTVAERTNREYQILPPDTEFVGMMDVLWDDPVREWQLGARRKLASKLLLGDLWLEKGEWNADRVLKELIVERLQAIILLGGFKSKGAGKVKITVAELK